MSAMENIVKIMKMVKAVNRNYFDVVFSANEYAKLTSHACGINIKYRNAGDHGFTLNYHRDPAKRSITVNGGVDVEGLIVKIMNKLVLIQNDKCDYIKNVNTLIRKVITCNHVRVHSVHDSKPIEVKSKNQQYTFFVYQRNFAILDKDKNYIFGGVIHKKQISFNDNPENQIHLAENILRTF